MENKQLTKILKKYYSDAMVKAIKSNKFRPSYEKMLLMRDNDGIKLDFWADVRAKIIRKPKNATTKPTK